VRISHGGWSGRTGVGFRADAIAGRADVLPTERDGVSQEIVRIHRSVSAQPLYGQSRQTAFQ
jgi:hypothetical protein